MVTIAPTMTTLGTPMTTTLDFCSACGASIRLQADNVHSVPLNSVPLNRATTGSAVIAGRM